MWCMHSRNGQQIFSWCLLFGIAGKSSCAYYNLAVLYFDCTEQWWSILFIATKFSIKNINNRFICKTMASQFDNDIQLQLSEKTTKTTDKKHAAYQSVVIRDFASFSLPFEPFFVFSFPFFIFFFFEDIYVNSKTVYHRDIPYDVSIEAKMKIPLPLFRIKPIKIILGSHYNVTMRCVHDFQSPKKVWW